MKRFISCLLVAVLLISCMATMAFAAKYNIGDTFTLSFTYDADPAISDYTATLSYDSAVVKLVKYSENVTGNDPATGLAFGNTCAYAQATNIAAGELFTATFEVVGAGETSISASFGDLFNAAGQEVTGATLSGGTTVSVPCAEHAWDAGVTTEATCTEDGKTVYTCTKCGETKTDVIAKLGHKYGDWTVTKAATCTEKGEEQRVCANDATHVETREVAAAGHKWTKWEEGEDGKLHRECTVCGAEETQDPTVYPGGDITPILTMGAVAMISLLAAVAYVFKRKFAK